MILYIFGSMEHHSEPWKIILMDNSECERVYMHERGEVKHHREKDRLIHTNAKQKPFSQTIFP